MDESGVIAKENEKYNGYLGNNTTSKQLEHDQMQKELLFGKEVITAL